MFEYFIEKNCSTSAIGTSATGTSATGTSATGTSATGTSASTNDDTNTDIDAPNFGYLKGVIPQCKSNFVAVHWILTIDRSGSMMETCKDGKTKIEHICRTVKHIVDYLYQLKYHLKGGII